MDEFLFLLINATRTTPEWVVDTASFASQELPSLALLALTGWGLAGPASRRRWLAVAVVALATAWMAARLMRWGLPAPRPFAQGLGIAWLEHAASPSFPSMHAAVAAAFAASFHALPGAVVARRCSWAVALLIGWSRVSLGLHFPSDIAAGILLGAACSLGIFGMARRSLPAAWQAAPG